MAKHWELFESKSLVYVQPLITRLCPLHVHKHGFIVHKHFITINCWSAVHYDISLQRTSLQRYIVVIYCLLCEILLQRSLARTISRRDIAKIVPIPRWFIVLRLGNPSDVSLIYHWLSFAILLHSTISTSAKDGDNPEPDPSSSSKSEHTGKKRQLMTACSLLRLNALKQRP